MVLCVLATALAHVSWHPGSKSKMIWAHYGYSCDATVMFDRHLLLRLLLGRCSVTVGFENMHAGIYRYFRVC